MTRKTLIPLFLGLALVAGVSCTEKDLQRESSVTLTFSTGDVISRAGDGNASDGGGIVLDGSGNPDLFIAIANYSGTIVARYLGADSATAELVSSSSTLISVRFKGISNSGDYSVYAVANTSGGVWGAPSSSSAWESITTATELDNLQFSALTGSDLPTVTDRMPLSAKGTLHVNEGLNGQAELELLRCVAKVGFKFKNETGEALELTGCNVTLKEINPTQGYLFPRANDAAGTIRNLVLINSTLSLADGVLTSLYGNLLVFPSIAPERAVGSRYYCDISFTVGGTPKTFTDLPVHDRQSQDILALGRNQYLQIETRINKGMDISFNFEVLDWREKEEVIIFH